MLRHHWITVVLYFKNCYVSVSRCLDGLADTPVAFQRGGLALVVWTPLSCCVPTATLGLAAECTKLGEECYLIAALLGFAIGCTSFTVAYSSSCPLGVYYLFVSLLFGFTFFA